MASKSRSRKTGTTTGTARTASSVNSLEDVMTSSGALALVADTATGTASDMAATSILPVVEAALAPIQDDQRAAEPVKPARRRSRKTPVTGAPSDGESAASGPSRKRSRKTATKPETAPEPEASPLAPVSNTLPFIVDTEADAHAGAADDARYADALAGAFLYAPELEAEGVPAAESTVGESAVSEAVVAEAVVAEAVVTEPIAEAEPAAEPAPVKAEATVDLPFIIDIPREVPVVDESPTAEWVERVLGSKAPEPSGDDEWVDQVLEPTKVSIPPRPRVRAEAASPASKTTAKAATKPAPKPATKPAPKAAPVAAAKPSAKIAPPRPTPGNTGKAELAPAAAASRWWVALPVTLLLALLFFVSRQGSSHAPVPADVMGTWTTAYWLYEHQTLEIKPDTIVATLDETEEGRFPITKVETTDAGRELAVKISYQNARGEEKEIDFLADKDPATALRFRLPTGLVWVRAE